MKHPVLGGPYNRLERREEEKMAGAKSHQQPPFITGVCDYSLNSITQRTHMEWQGHIKGYSKEGEIGKRVDNDRGTEKQGEKEREGIKAE